MGVSRGVLALASFLLVAATASLVANGQPLVPALNIFGDSVVDSGNNNNLYTLVKANFPPYGRDFVNHRPTGRFCNGKLATDFTAEFLGFTSYPPAYLTEGARGNNILAGANFASASSGYSNSTAASYHAVSLPMQVEYYKDWQRKIVSMVGRDKSKAIFSGALHLLNTGNSDFLQNYYINPVLCGTYSPNQFSDILLRSYARFVQSLYGLGARRIGVTSLPPIGCLPASITLFGGGSNQCVARLNADAIMFNNKLKSTSQSLKKQHPDLKLVVLDIYQPLMDIIAKPADNGFFEARKACCGTGTIETSLLCNARSVGTCANATEYVFWDSFHPTEAANQVLAQAILGQGIDLVT